MTTADRLAWRTSSRSSNGENCVEVAPTADGVVIRHSKHRDAGTIAFTYPAWTVFVDEAHQGLPSANGTAAIIASDTGTLVRCLRTGIELRFDEGEWTAFVAGAARGEFAFSERLASAAS